MSFTAAHQQPFLRPTHLVKQNDKGPSSENARTNAQHPPPPLTVALTRHITSPLHYLLVTDVFMERFWYVLIRTAEPVKKERKMRFQNQHGWEGGWEVGGLGFTRNAVTTGQVRRREKGMCEGAKKKLGWNAHIHTHVLAWSCVCVRAHACVTLARPAGKVGRRESQCGSSQAFTPRLAGFITATNHWPDKSSYFILPSFTSVLLCLCSSLFWIPPSPHSLLPPLSRSLHPLSIFFFPHSPVFCVLISLPSAVVLSSYLSCFSLDSTFCSLSPLPSVQCDESLDGG